MDTKKVINQNQTDPLTDTIIEQILTVRDTGRTNMFDVQTVAVIANELELYELVAFLSDRKNWSSYAEFILHGKTKQENH